MQSYFGSKKKKRSSGSSLCSGSHRFTVSRCIGSSFKRRKSNFGNFDDASTIATRHTIHKSTLSVRVDLSNCSLLSKSNNAKRISREADSASHKPDNRGDDNIDDRVAIENKALQVSREQQSLLADQGLIQQHIEGPSGESFVTTVREQVVLLENLPNRSSRSGSHRRSRSSASTNGCSHDSNSKRHSRCRRPSQASASTNGPIQGIQQSSRKSATVTSRSLPFAMNHCHQHLASSVTATLSNQSLHRFDFDFRPGFDTLLSGNDKSQDTCPVIFGNVNQATVDSVHAKFTSGADLHFEKPIVVDRDNLSLQWHRIEENFLSTSMWMAFESRSSSELMEKPSSKRASLDLFCIQKLGIDVLYAIQGPSKCQGQIYCVDNGGECHYEEPLQSLFNFISMTKLKLVLFPNTMTCASAHVIAINDQEILKPFIEIYDFYQTNWLVSKYSSTQVKKADCQASRTEHSTCSFGAASLRNSRPATLKDLENHSHQTLSSIDSVTQRRFLKFNQTISRFHKGTNEPSVRKKITMLSSILVWLFGTKMVESPLQFIDDDQIVIEAITSGCRDQNCPAGWSVGEFKHWFPSVLCHYDDLNCNGSVLSRQFLGVFKYCDEQNHLYTDIGYTRSAVFDTFSRLQKLEIACNDIHKMIKYDFPPCRTSFLPRDLTPRRPPNLIVPNVEMHQTHIDATFSMQGILYSLLLLCEKFNLNLVEIVSLLSTIDYCGHNYFFWIASAWMYMEYPVGRHRSDFDVYGTGIHFGWNF